MNKKIDELLDELLDKLLKETNKKTGKKLEEMEEENKNNFNKNRKKIVENATKNAKEAEQCFICVTESAMQLNGNTLTLMTGLGKLVHALKKNGIPKELLENVFKAGLNDDEEDDELEKKLEEQLNLLKENLEKLKDAL